MEQIHEDGSRLPGPDSLPRAPLNPKHASWPAYWTAFVAHFRPFLLRVAGTMFRRCGAAQRADDLAEVAVQDFLVALMARGWLARTEVIRQPRPFLKTLLSRHILDTYRRSCALKRGGGRRRVPADLDRYPSPPTGGVAETDASSWLQQAIEVALQRLQATEGGPCSELVRDMIRVMDGGRTSPDLPQRLGFHLMNLAVRKHRARRALLRELAGALREISATPEIARDRYLWVKRRVSRQPPPPKLRGPRRAPCSAPASTHSAQDRNRRPRPPRAA